MARSIVDLVHRRTLHVLVAVDLVFVVLHVAHLLAASGSTVAAEAFSLTTESGYAEWFGYAKGLTAVTALVLAFRAVREPVHLGWAVTLLIVVADDSLAVHERVGEWLVSTLGVPDVSRLRAQDFGEMAVWAVLGVVAVAIVASTHRASGPGARRASVAMAVVVAGLVFFVVPMDMLSIAAPWRLKPIVSLLEDGGELLALSILAALAVGVWRSGRGPVAHDGEPAAPAGSVRSVPDR